MSSRVFSLVILAGALASAPALGYRAEFEATFDGKRLAGAEVCFFAASTGADPLGHFFQSPDVSCVPADRVVDLPPGRWNYFVRHADGYVSARPGLLTYLGKPIPEWGYRSIPIELMPAALLTFEDVRLLADEYVVAYYPTPFHGPSNAHPLESGHRELLVPAGTPVIPMIVRSGRPVAVGNPVTLTPGTVQKATGLDRQADRLDVVTWLDVDYDRISAMKDPLLKGPAVVLSTGLRDMPPLLEVPDPRFGHLALVIFRDAQPGSRIRLRGQGWVADEIETSQTSGGVLVTSRGLRLTPGGVVKIVWEIPRAYEPRCRYQDASGPLMRATVRLLSCQLGLSRPDSQCLVLVEETVDPFESGGILEMEGVPSGEHWVELRDEPFGSAYTRFLSVPGKAVRVSVAVETVSIEGRVVQRGAPVQASVRVGGFKAETDAGTGGFQLLVAGEIDRAEITIQECGSGLLHQFERPLKKSARLEIELPETRLLAEVFDADTGRLVPGARASLAVGVAGGGEDTEFTRELLFDEERSLFYGATMLPLGRALRVCAFAPTHKHRCSDWFTLQAVTEDRTVRLELEAKRGLSGRFESPEPFLRAVLFAADAGGVARETTAVDSNGIFQFDAAFPTGGYLVLVSQSHPLFAFRPVKMSEELSISVPPGDGRRFVVQSGSRPSARVGIMVGDLRIPQHAFEEHQMRKSLGIILSPTAGVLIADVLEVAPISILLGPPLAPGGPADPFDPTTGGPTSRAVLGENDLVTFP